MAQIVGRLPDGKCVLADSEDLLPEGAMKIGVALSPLPAKESCYLYPPFTCVFPKVEARQTEPVIVKTEMKATWLTTEFLNSVLTEKPDEEEDSVEAMLERVRRL